MLSSKRFTFDWDQNRMAVNLDLELLGPKIDIFMPDTFRPINQFMIELFMWYKTNNKCFSWLVKVFVKHEGHIIVISTLEKEISSEKNKKNNVMWHGPSTAKEINC